MELWNLNINFDLNVIKINFKKIQSDNRDRIAEPEIYLNLNEKWLVFLQTLLRKGASLITQREVQIFSCTGEKWERNCWSDLIVLPTQMSSNRAKRMRRLREFSSSTIMSLSIV